MNRNKLVMDNSKDTEVSEYPQTQMPTTKYPYLS